MLRTCSQDRCSARSNTRNIAAVPVLALIIVTSTILYAVTTRMTWAQSELVFQKIWGGSDITDVGNGVALDSLGNIYVTGRTQFGPDNLILPGSVFLLKYDPTGTLAWQTIWSGNSSGGDNGSAVAVDSSGNIYVTGWTSSVGAGMSDILLLKFNSSGSLVWQRTYGSSGDDQGSSVAVDSSGNIYVTGDIQGFGAGSDDVLLLKFDSSGNLLWQKTWGGTHFEYGSGVAVDSSGDIYVTGSATSFVTGMGDVFLLRFDSSGSLVWQKTWDPTQVGFASGNGVAVNSSGDIYVTGNFYHAGAYDILLLKFDSSGSLTWQRTWDGGSWDYGENVVVDPSGGVYVGGYISAYDVLLLRFDSSGNHAGQVTWGRNEPFSEHGNDVVVDSSGNAVVTGFVDAGPPFTLDYPEGTIGAPSFSLGDPNFTLDTPSFLPYTPTGTVDTPSGSESNTGSKVNDAFLLKFTPLDYTENYTENLVFGLPPIAFYGLIGGAVVLIGALTTILLQMRRKTLTTQPATPPPPSPPAQTQAQAEKTTAGFILSLIGGIMILTFGLVYILPYLLTTKAAFGTFTLSSTMATISATGIICGTIVIIGAILIRTPGKNTVGGILVIIFSLISIFGLGGLIIGLILGTIGGALGLAKPNRAKAALGFALALAAGTLSIFWGVGTINEALHPPSGWIVLFTIRASVPAWFARVNLGTLGWIEVASGVIVIIGAFLIFMPGKEKIGSILAIAFSIVGAIILGSISLMFAPLGILGGVLGLLKSRNS